MGVFRQFPYSNFHEMNMDDIIKIVKNMLEEWAQYYDTWDNWKDQVTQEWEEMQSFINNYFDNLNVQNEINNKITSMVLSGEFGQIVDPYVPPAVSSWLAQHITTPETVVIDDSLSIEGAVADAKATGDAIGDAKNDIYDAIISDEKYIIGKSNLLTGVNWVDGYYISAEGVITADQFNNYSDLIPVSSDKNYTFVWKLEGSASNIRIHGYDTNGDWVEQITVVSSGISGSKITFTNFDNSVVNIRISMSKQSTPLALFDGVNLQTQIDTLNNANIQIFSKFNDINKLIETEKIPYISAPTRTTSTTNYIAVVVPSSVFNNGTANKMKWDCFCNDEVTVYQSLYDVDLTQTGNLRITTRLVGATYTDVSDNGWYRYNVTNYPTVAPAGDYVALLFNVVPTDGVLRVIDAYFRNITINDTIVDGIIKEVFLYSASVTGSEIVKLIDADIITLLTPEYKQLGNGNILCIGDSLTAGVYASDELVHSENYPYYMKNLINNTIINKGMPGYSASMYWNNNVLQNVDFTNVKHIIIMLGTNGGLTDTLDTDVFPYEDYSDYATTKTGCYCKIIEYCMEHAPDAEIYLCTTPFFNKDLQPNFAPPTTPNANIVIPKIAEYYHFSMIDVRNGMGVNEKNTLYFQSDGLHGDAKFYQKLGTFIGSQIKAKASYIL